LKELLNKELVDKCPKRRLRVIATSAAFSTSRYSRPPHTHTFLRHVYPIKRTLCVVLQGSMPPFLNNELVDKCLKRRLKVIGDVSCDPNSTNNPIPLYDTITSW
jgi:hypothetical protein